MNKRDGFKFTVCDMHDAIKTISSMQDVIMEYGYVTIKDFFDLMDLPDDDRTKDLVKYVNSIYKHGVYGWSDDISFKLHKLDDDHIVITLSEPKLLPYSLISESIYATNYKKMVVNSMYGIPVYNPEGLNTHDEEAKSYLDTDDVSPKPDMVNNPPHYQSETGLEVIDVIEAFTFDLKGIEATDTGNAIKYICRWKNKNGVQDLKKAQWYINHLIEHVELLEKENNENNKKEND